MWASSEHGRALPFIIFSVFAAIGSVQDKADHRFLARVLCELVAVTNEIFAEPCTGGSTTGAQAAVVAERAQSCVMEYYQRVLGPSHTTKLHRLALHLLEEFHLRGNIDDCNTGFNEQLHKAVKEAYKATNKRRDQLVEQLLVSHQAAASLLEEDEGPIAVGSDATSANARQRIRHLRFSHRGTAAQLALKRNLPGLCAVLEVAESTNLFYCDSVYSGHPSAPRRGQVANTIRAAANLHGAPWYDWMQYRGPGGTKCYGQDALVVESRAERHLYVSRLECLQ